MFLLDTDILSNLVSRAPSTSLVRRMAAVSREQQFTSSITLGEILYGAYRLGARAQELFDRFERVLWPNLVVVRFDAPAAHQYARVRAELEQRGTLIGDADLRIAAIARARNLTMVTGNARHFECVPGLQVENWLSPS
ncbi:MAG: type II toxin-antitoxin system VapC family toxin [Dehalococcoidia bacterium]|nr:type II toxin-antitoxin system VapC family toxin [Dehalococcoidia bacterium]